jgi:hypothetical protein
MSDGPRTELIKLETDRRLGHEWDEWDGSPLPRDGDFDSPPRLFFVWSAAATAVGLGILFGALWLLRPHLGSIHPSLVTAATITVAAIAAIAWTWWALLSASYLLRRPLLPERLAERGLYLRLMSWTSRVASRFGRRDWVENAAVKVYNTLALIRNRKVNTGELLLLVRNDPSLFQESLMNYENYFRSIVPDERKWTLHVANPGKSPPLSKGSFEKIGKMLPRPSLSRQRARVKI